MRFNSEGSALPSVTSIGANLPSVFAGLDYRAGRDNTAGTERYHSTDLQSQPSAP